MKQLCISPEALLIAETYLETLNIGATALALSLPKDQVVDAMKKAEVKSFLDVVYQDVGYRNKHRLGSLMDNLIDKKLEEMEDAGLESSNKDIADLIALQHKMSIENKKLDLELVKAQNQVPSTQINVQKNYNSLVERILTAWVQNIQLDYVRTK